jgi:hypothetical protein
MSPGRPPIPAGVCSDEYRRVAHLPGRRPPLAVNLGRPATQPGAPGFIEQPWVHYLILGSFLLLTVPLCIVAAVSDNFLRPWSLGWLYVCALGTTHFALTLTVYLQSSNLTYFNSSWLKRALYFLVPVLIFVFFDLYRTLQIALLLPAVDLAVRGGIRLLDFQHFNRQSFGVFQLFKGRSRAFPCWLRRVENGYFLGLTALLFLSFLTSGRFDGNNYYTRLALLPTGICLAILVGTYARTWAQSTNRRALVAPLAYFLLQSLSAMLAIYNIAFYLCCLAMHYVEYHVLMYPRCFHTPLNPHSRVDRFFAALRRRKVVFYAALFGLAGLITACTWAGMGALIERDGGSASASYLPLISVFDGLFVFHYFVESLFWKLSDPHYRQTLGPLYFSPAAPRPAANPG